MKKYILPIVTASLAVCLIIIASCLVFSNEDMVQVFKTVETTEETTAETTTFEPTTETTTEAAEVSLVMIGDILAHEGVYGSALQADGTYNFDHLFANIKDDVLKSDLALVNQEVILGGKELGLSAYPLFNSPTELGDALVNAGFNVVLHATNHTLDKGEQGVTNTIDFWRQSHPDTAVLGIHQSPEDYEENSIYYYQKQNLKIAILNYTYGTNGIPVPAGKEYIINLLEEDKVKADIEKANQNADFVIVCPHWGTEYRTTPDDYELRWAKLLTEWGADLIIGTHPHVIQPVETVTADNGNTALVYYSLGNFVSNQDKNLTMLGAMARLTISNEGGDAHIKDYEAIPLVTHMLFGRNLITTYKITDYTDELAAQNKIHLYDSGFSLSYLEETSKQILGEAYKNSSN